MKTKRCSKCDRTLPLAAFSRNKGTRDGRKYSCKRCAAKAEKERVREKPRRPVIFCRRCRTYKVREEFPQFSTRRGSICSACRAEEGLADPAKERVGTLMCSLCGDRRPRAEFAPRGYGRRGRHCAGCREAERVGAEAARPGPTHTPTPEYAPGSRGWQRLEEEREARKQEAFDALRANREEAKR